MNLGSPEQHSSGDDSPLTLSPPSPTTPATPHNPLGQKGPKKPVHTTVVQSLTKSDTPPSTPPTRTSSLIRIHSKQISLQASTPKSGTTPQHGCAKGPNDERRMKLEAYLTPPSSKPKPSTESTNTTSDGDSTNPFALISPIRSANWRVIHYPNGRSYRGDVDPTTNRRHGYGRLDEKGSEVVYCGEWVNHQKNGKGMMVYGKDGTYEGTWKNNRLDGSGKLAYQGFEYTGGFRDGKFEGQGVLCYPNGDSFNGQWQANKRANAGPAELKCRNGDVYTFNGNDLQLGEGQVARGVTIRYESGDVFEGYLRNGKKHGEGTLRLADGSVYVGGFKEGQMEGPGTLKFGKPKLLGVRAEETLPNWEFEYRGGWKRCKFEGWGTLENLVTHVKKEGQWKSGNFIA